MKYHCYLFLSIMKWLTTDSSGDQKEKGNLKFYRKIVFGNDQKAQCYLFRKLTLNQGSGKLIYKNQFRKNMRLNSQATAPGAPLQTLTKRKANLDRIRNSLQNFNLLKQNQNLAFNRLQLQKNTLKDSESEGSSATEIQEFKTDVLKAEIFSEKYELLEKLGEGSSGVVNRCLKKSTGKEYAVKTFRFQDEHLPGLKANFLVINNLNHPNIISYESLYVDSKKHIGYLVMELVRSPSLDQVNLKGEEQIKNVIGQVLDALSYLHRHDIVHRDIKPENILYDEKTKQIKIIDFGISRRFKRRGSRFEMWTITGTLFYRAPEMFSGGYREGVDIWAVGVLIFQLVCGRTPFESEYHSQTIKNIQEIELVLSREFSRYSHELRSLLLRMLIRNPEERADACSCLRDPWLSDLPLRRMKSQKTLHSKEKENSFAVNYRPCKHSDKAKAEMSMTINEDILKECNSNKDIFLGRPHLRKIEGSQIEFIESDPHA